MAKKKRTTTKKKRKSSKKTAKQSVLEVITPDEALRILRVLAEQDVAVARKINEVAEQQLGTVDADEIAGTVQLDLELLDVEDIFTNSGSSHDGYVDPNDYAWEMFEEALKPFVDEMRRLAKLGKREWAKSYCMGILKGLYDFENESSTEYKDWADDAPKSFFMQVWEALEKTGALQNHLAQVDAFVEGHCPDWAR